jgi:hypothetical protein
LQNLGHEIVAHRVPSAPPQSKGDTASLERSPAHQIASGNERREDRNHGGRLHRYRGTIGSLSLTIRRISDHTARIGKDRLLG